MKNLKIILVLLIASGPILADDVYNFYFQKAPGPQTVIQGDGKMAMQPAPTSTSSAETKAESSIKSQAETKPVAEDKAPATQSESTVPNFKHWEIFGGYGLVSTPLSYTYNSTSASASASGYTLGINYNFLNYFG